MYKMSIVIPVYYNELNLPHTYQKLQEEVLNKLEDYELILVDDGSEDSSYQVMQDIRQKDNKVKLVKLSHNFGLNPHHTICPTIEEFFSLVFFIISATCLSIKKQSNPPKGIFFKAILRMMR